MRHGPLVLTATVLAWLCILAPAQAITVSGNTLTLTDEEMQACAAGGGCVLAPVDAIKASIAQRQQEAFEVGVDAGAAASCKRDKTV